MTLGETYALDFEDGTSLWITAVRLPDRLSITAELKNEPL